MKIKILNGVGKQRYLILERCSMTTSDFAGVTELEKYLREALHKMTREANGRAAQIIAGAIQSIRADSERLTVEIQ